MASAKTKSTINMDGTPLTFPPRGGVHAYAYINRRTCGNKALPVIAAENDGNLACTTSYPWPESLRHGLMPDRRSSVPSRWRQTFRRSSCRPISERGNPQRGCTADTNTLSTPFTSGDRRFINTKKMFGCEMFTITGEILWLHPNSTKFMSADRRMMPVDARTGFRCAEYSQSSIPL